LRSLITLIALSFALTGSALAAGDLGVGAMLGNPSGVALKKWLENDHAIDGGVGFSVGSDTNLTLHSDYLLQTKGAFFFNDVHSLDLYYGLGGRMKFADDIQVGLRVPVGVAHRLESEAVDLFGEVAPVIDFIGRNGIDLNLAIGGRFYF
jgi:hypothetical protein